MQVALALGLLIFVHELGHFLAAKWAGVRVEVFSFGFGPFLFSFRKGDTIYAFSLIPLGGYVRMTGQSDTGRVKEEEKKVPHSYLAKSPGKRAVIIVAGVTMNVIFAFVVFAAAHMAGIIDVPPLVGEVYPGSPAAEAKIAKGDRILAVKGSPITRFNDLRLAVANSDAGTPLDLLVRRANGTTEETIEAVPKTNERGVTSLGIPLPQREARLRIGATNAQGLGVIFVGPKSPAKAAGLKEWDHVVTVNGRAFGDLAGFKAALSDAGGAEVTLGVRRGGESVELQVTPELKSGGYVVGFRPTPVGVVGEVTEGSEAHAEGMHPGAFITDVIESLDRKSVELAWRNPDGSTGGAVLQNAAGGPEFVTTTIVRELLPGGGFVAAWRSAARESVDSVRKTFDTLVSLLSRRVPAKEMTSIVGIAYVTYQSTKSGLGNYLWLVGFISINLAIINLVPMMPLDGGLLLFLLYEAVRGKQASQRVQEIAQIVGMVLILALIIFVLSNDYNRFWGGPS
jgi:regulator of sigma E protease